MPIHDPKAMGTKSPNPFLLGHVGPPLIHPCRDRPHSSPQTASGSTQPFCHNTLSGQTDRLTDRQTDRWSRRETCTKSAYAIQRRTNNIVHIYRHSLLLLLSLRADNCVMDVNQLSKSHIFSSSARETQLCRTRLVNQSLLRHDSPTFTSLQ